MKAYMFVYNNCSRDARVLKEARSLTKAGHHVRIIAVLDKITQPYEERDGFVIERVVKNPIHYRLFRLARLPRRTFWGAARRILRLCQWLLGIARRLGLAKLLESFSRLPLSIQLSRKRAKLGLGLVLWPVHLLGLAARRVCVATRRFVKSAMLLMMRPLRRFIMYFHRPLSFLDYYFRAYRIVKQSPGDIYHAHDLNTLPVAWWAQRRLGGKLVYDSHELYTETSTLGHFERKLATAVERVFIGACDIVITVNESIAEELVNRYRIRPPTVIMNCPDMKLASEDSALIRQKLGIASDEPVILYQGGFSPNRGLENLLLALHYVPRGALVFMGWGRLEEQLRSQASQEGWSNQRVFFLPPVPQEELLSWSASADVGVIPYRAVGLNNYYSLPNKFFEYIAAGLPVAASAFPELTRVIEGHGIGVTFDPEDPKSIAHAIRSILEDDKARERMRGNARKAAMLYNWQREEKKLIEIYRGLDK
jgi:glycosyltransferase involved in cell wall biosynthesis